ncbi:cystathionine beta-lyase [Dethiosulfatarculus sandiegensis]|uniref:Cystathionine beta-lyase n=1 Tax=Dethiosulfatarculus sandiegensis TaxID=1429043 RepID=A0A0D2IYL8_9BACT|nr:cystathionine beta-lyase [Dethiosulfatarculus sandiegensis]KIX11114.1 cystathionine beta-lyase [Dethiosulfatarculus sandiegensis]
MKTDTRIIHSGRHPEENHGVVNPPVYHASTILFPTVEKLEHRDPTKRKSIHYGLYGTPTTFGLEDALAELEGGYDTKLFPSGLAAITVPMMAYLKAGDHLLMVDSVYGPTRRFCDNWLTRFGVETTYYDPMIGAGIRDLFKGNTKLVFLESPGSITFEVQDVPAICAEAKARGITTMIDNTWATPLYFKPFEHGVDVSLHAGTKYINGHSDVMLGTATATEEAFPALSKAATEFGQTIAPDDSYLALRGLRTISLRLNRHEKTALKLAHWLEDRVEVERVLHPALPSCPGHEFWKRDFLGSSGLFGLLLKPASKKALAAMLDNMELFKMGYSWGGFESLILPHDPADIRTATKWQAEGPLLRLHAGLEDPEDLIRDLEKGFERLNQAG